MSWAMKKILVIISNFNGIGGAETALYRFLSRSSRERFCIDVCFFGYEDEFARAIKGFVNDVYCLDVKKTGHLAAFRQLLRLAGNGKYHMVHTHLALADVYGLLLGYFRPVRLISTEHNISDRRKTTAPGRVYYFLARRRFHRFIGVSSKVVDWLQNAGIPAEKLAVIPNPIEFDNREPPEAGSRSELLHACGWPEDSVLIGSVANLRRVKGLNYLVEGMGILVNRGVNARLVLVGDGPERGNLEKQVQELGLAGHVMLPGFIKDARHMLPLFDIYVSPSLMEGFGISIVEAMSCGLPVVATAVGGVTDFLTHMENAYLVSPGDPLELAAGISYLAGHGVEARKMRTRALLDSRRFRTENLVPLLERLYEE